MAKKFKPKASRNSPSWSAPGIWVALTLASLSFGLYFNSLDNDLLFDDVTLVLQNPQVINLEWFGILFKSGYRPVRTLTYAVNYWIGGDDPFGYHLFNVLLHSANVVLAFYFLRRLMGNGIGPFAGALLFAVHPVQTAAVAYVSGRKDLLAAFFVLLALLCYFKSRSGGKASLGWSAGAASAFVLAVFSKEVAIILPAIVLLMESALPPVDGQNHGDRTRFPLWQSIRRAVMGRPWLYGIFGITAAAAAVHSLFLVKASRMESYWGGDFGTNLGTGAQLFVHYVKMVFYPFPLLADYLGGVFPISTGISEPATLGAILLGLGFVALSAWALHRSPLVGFGMFWFLLAISPILQLIPFHELAADHFLYVPLIGAAVVAGAAARTLVRSSHPAVALVVFGLFAVACGKVVVARNQEWQDKQSLWEATYRDAPDSYRANANLGQIYFSQGRVEEGMRLTRRATELDPGNPLPYGNLGAMYYTVAQKERAAGRFTEAMNLQRSARQHLEKALRLEPHNPFTLSNLGNTYKEDALILDALGSPGEAAAARSQAELVYQRAIRSPDRRLDVQRIWFNLGLLETDAGNYSEALKYLRRYLTAFPDDGNANYWMGNAFFNTREYGRAVPHFWAALESKDRPEVRQKLAASYELLGRFERALPVREALAKRFPSADNYRDLGNLYQRLGDPVRARQAWDAAARQPGGGVRVLDAQPAGPQPAMSESHVQGS